MASTTSYGRFGVDVSCVLPLDSPILGFVRQQGTVVVRIHGGRVSWCRWSGCWDLRSTQTSAKAFCCPSPLCLIAGDEAVARLAVADLAGCIGSLFCPFLCLLRFCAVVRGSDGGDSLLSVLLFMAEWCLGFLRFEVHVRPIYRPYIYHVLVLAAVFVIGR